MADTITTDTAWDIIDGKPVAVQDVSQHRWYTKQLVVYTTLDGRLMGFYYLRPATEEQEGMDNFEAEPVPIFPVVARQVTTTTYAPESA